MKSNWSHQHQCHLSTMDLQTTLMEVLAVLMAVLFQAGFGIETFEPTERPVVQDTVGSCSIERCPECRQGREYPLDCGWCGDQCYRFDECPLKKNFSLHRCPKPVYHVHPTNGSIYGGTPITIEGDNLGRPDHETYSSIKILVGESICHVVLRSSKSVVCKTRHWEKKSSRGLNKFKVDIFITVNDTHRSYSKKYNVLDRHVITSGFEYMVVRYSGVTPNYGPVSGNTNITIRGHNLDVGHQPAVEIGDALCHIQRKNSTHLECSRDAVARDLVDQEKEVILRTDGVRVPFHSQNNLRHRFTFKPYPVVTDIVPKRSMFSRNFTVAVKGAHLDRVAKPIIVTRGTFPGQENEYLTKVCQPMENGQKMMCPATPLVEFVARNRGLEAGDSDIEAQISFHMDGLHLPLDQNGDGGHFKLVYHPPPVFYSFPGVLSFDPATLQ